SVLSLKIRPRYIDYRVFNYCATCKIKILSKETLRCPECNQKVDSHLGIEVKPCLLNASSVM
ncbi:MAG: hypothetical protein WBZ20_05565, partial [Nitrososphaeraceae archaeon]